MSNDVLLVPVNVEQPNVEAQSDIVVYVPQAHKNKAGIVKEGDGINIENGVVSLDRQTVEDMIDANKWVSYGFQQNLTEDEKGLARHNIGAGDNDFTGSYYDVTQKPHLNTDNSASLPIGDEEINNTVNLHKVSKTGSFDDLNDVPTKTIDFAESERQKSENIYEYLGDGAINVGYGYVAKTDHKWYPNQPFARTVFMKCKPNTTYHVTKIAGGRFAVASFNVATENLIPDNEAIANVYVSEGAEGQGVTYLKITTSSNDNRLAVFCVDTSLDPNVEEILQSIEVSEFGEIVHKYTPSNAFAESERQKSKNLFVLLDDDRTIVDVNIKSNRVSQQLTFNGNAVGLNESRIGRIEPITLKAGHTYVMSSKVVSGNYDGALSVGIYNTGLGYFTNVVAVSFEESTNVTKITPTEDMYFNALRWYINTGTVCNNFIVSLQIEENDVASDWQYPHGAIVHEKDIFEVIYDNSTKNTLNGVAYTSGIPTNTELSMDLLKYKYAKIYTTGFGIILLTIDDSSYAKIAGADSYNVVNAVAYDDRIRVKYDSTTKIFIYYAWENKTTLNISDIKRIEGVLL